MRVNYIAEASAKRFKKNCLVPMNGGLYVSLKETSVMPQDNHQDWKVFVPQKANSGRNDIFSTILERLDKLEATHP